MPFTMSTHMASLAGLGVALVPLAVPWLKQLVLADRLGLISPLNQSIPLTKLASHDRETSFICQPQNYTTQIISLDPLVMYIHNFLHEKEIENILAVSEPLLKPSTVTKDGVTTRSEYRTSWSAEVPRENPAVQCIEERVWHFMGTMMARGRDAVEPPQIVRYTSEQRFKVHHDWYEGPQREQLGRRRAWNRLASFFAIMQDNCTEGETYFPHVVPYTDASRDSAVDEGNKVWREHEDGGLAFRPIRGNALFWMNLFPNGRGDERVAHAGLPVKMGVKTAMNIWPRRYTGPDAWDPPTAQSF
ncbi:2og-fe oxygenase family [Rhypophila sp. PSN 637]